MKEYQYRAEVAITGGYPGEEQYVYDENGVRIPSPPLITVPISTDVKEAIYYYSYRDSGVVGGDNNNSSRVYIKVKDSWNAQIDGRNNLIINVTSSILSFVRDDLRPVGGQTANAYFNITVYGERDGGREQLREKLRDPINTAHVIFPNVSITTSHNTFIIPPGNATAGKSTIYIHSQNADYPQFYDDVYIGLRFYNPLPPDYRPGMSYNGTDFMSHNRNGGACNVWNGSGWQEMRTIAGGVEKDNPPLSYHDNDWWNMKKIGKE